MLSLLAFLAKIMGLPKWRATTAAKAMPLASAVRMTSTLPMSK